MNNESVKSINELIEKLKEAIEEIKGIDTKDLVMDVRGPQLKAIDKSLGQIEGLLEKETEPHEIESCLVELKDICLDVDGIADGVKRRREKSFGNFFEDEFQKTRELVDEILDKGYSYLFSINGKEDELKNITVEEMTNIFRSHSIVFKNAKFYLKDENKKTIMDYLDKKDRTKEKRYYLIKEKERLDVYEKFKNYDIEKRQLGKGDNAIVRSVSAKPCLFSLDLTYKECFKENKVKEKLKKAFEDKKILLDKDNAIISKMNNDWVIKDRDMTYLIKEERGKLNVYGKEKFTFAVKKPISEKIIKKKEYLLMLEFKKFLPDNLPKVYDWDEEYQMIIMEEIKGRELVKIPKEEFFKNPQLIAKLGEIIAVMHNNNFIHGDPHGGNIMLDEKNIWKLIDFGASHHLGKGVDKITAKLFEYFLIKLKALNTRGLSDKRIVSQFYPTYFINRNYRDTVSYLIKKKDSKALNGLFDVVEFVVENIDSHSQQVDKCLSGLIFQMYDLIQKHCPKNEKFKSIVDDFKNKISKNPNINLRISDEESMSIHSDEERLEKPIDSEGVGNLMDKDGFPVSDQNPSQLTPVEKEAKEAITNLKKTIEELSNALNEERNHEEINAEENTPQ